MPKYHGLECKIFEEAGIFKNDPITTFKQAKSVYMYLTPLRFLCKAESVTEILDLDDKMQERADTLIYFLNLHKLVKPLHKLLGLSNRFSVESIQVCLFLLIFTHYLMRFEPN